MFTKINNDIVICDGAFTEEELATIENSCDLHMETHGVITKMAGISYAMWVPRAANTKLIYSKMADVCRKANEQFFNFDITGYIDEGILFLEYRDPGHHFDWHVDNSESYRGKIEPVKLIVILQLTDPSNYEGAVAEVAGTGITQLPKKRDRKSTRLNSSH